MMYLFTVSENRRLRYIFTWNDPLEVYDDMTFRLASTFVNKRWGFILGPKVEIKSEAIFQQKKSPEKATTVRTKPLVQKKELVFKWLF